MKGYQKLAGFISATSGLDLYRKFRALNASNLLYLQAELTHLEAQLSDIIVEDEVAGQNGDPEKLNLSVSWVALKSTKDIPGGDLQYEKVMEIRAALKEYDNTLLRQAALNELEQAPAKEHHLLQKWLSMDVGGNHFLQNREADPWCDENIEDLVRVSKGPVNVELFTRIWKTKLLSCYHYYVGHRIKKPLPGDDWKGVYKYDETTITAVTKVLGTALAALIPTASIFTLYFVQQPLVRLGLITGFVLTFAIALAIFTRANMFEMFAATTAFAAVQVVFVAGVQSY